MNPPRSEGYVRMLGAEFEAILTRPAEEAGQLAERLETMEKTHHAQRKMLEAAACRPRSRDDLAERLRDGRF